MKVLVVGSGGREHALAWKIALDSNRPDVFCAPGNAGTATVGTNLDITATDLDGITKWAVKQQIDLAVIGPEAPLCAGLTDRLEAAGIPVFGPNADAARLEASKTFAKDVMKAAGVPTAAAEAFTDSESACRYIEAQGAPIVVKADGLAAGKGVTVCETVDQACRAVREALDEGTFGEAGGRVLIEECLQGEEASILALVDGEHILPLASSQDHKRAHDGDKGPNTGGMGAYSPAPIVSDELMADVKKTVLEPVINEMKKRGITYRGVLYAGLMITPKGPQVLEFNCRFGDPETQAVLARWAGDILPALQACANGTLQDDMVAWKNETAVCVVMAAGGYPGPYRKGDEITGLAEADALPGTVVFHAGTALQNGKVVTAGGRVLGVTACGDTLPEAVERAYRAARTIRFDDAQYRSDIAHRAL